MDREWSQIREARIQSITRSGVSTKEDRLALGKGIGRSLLVGPSGHPELVPPSGTIGLGSSKLVKTVDD